jgi:hypothetical protein
MRALTATVLAAGLALVACDSLPQEATMAPDVSHQTVPDAARLPFHAWVDWQFVQVPLPAGRCTAPLPAGMSYLWLTRLTGTAVSTHLGEGAFEGSICIYGQLVDPGADPPANGVPFGWQDGVFVLTAANGDRLHGTEWSTGVTAPPGTPGWQFTEQGTFVDGGTGRFEHAEGEFTGLVDPVAQTAVYDGWIRFGRGNG